MNQQDFERVHAKRFQQRVADIVIGPSVARNQGFAGAVDTARSFVAEMDLRKFAQTRNETKFQNFLDQRTIELQKRLKERRKKWVP